MTKETFVTLSMRVFLKQMRSIVDYTKCGDNFKAVNHIGGKCVVFTFIRGDGNCSNYANNKKVICTYIKMSALVVTLSVGVSLCTSAFVMSFHFTNGA